MSLVTPLFCRQDYSCCPTDWVYLPLKLIALSLSEHLILEGEYHKVKPLPQTRPQGCCRRLCSVLSRAQTSARLASCRYA